MRLTVAMQSLCRIERTMVRRRSSRFRFLPGSHMHHPGGHHYRYITSLPVPERQEQPLRVQYAVPGQNSTSRASSGIPHMLVPSLAHATNPDHVAQIASLLSSHTGVSHESKGILKLTLAFSDPSSSYLEQLIRSLHANHGHRLPISHSATVNWFWDVRPTAPKLTLQSSPAPAPAATNGPGVLARSETMEEFPWHTDCSYEEPPPRYIALHVLQHDRCGGGTLSLLNVAGLVDSLTRTTREALQRREYTIATPPEFVKDPEQRSITGPLLANTGNGRDDWGWTMRFRRDIIQPTSKRAARALEELDRVVNSRQVLQDHVLHLSPQDLPSSSIILLDNRRWLHCRNEVRDPGRHLRRVRWDAVPFGEGVA